MSKITNMLLTILGGALAVMSLITNDHHREIIGMIFWACGLILWELNDMKKEQK